MATKSVMTLHEVLDKLGRAQFGEDWTDGDWIGYLTAVDTSDLLDGKYPHKPKVKRQSEMGRAVISRLYGYVRSKVLVPFVIKGKLKKEIPVHAFEFLDFMKNVLKSGKIAVRYSTLHALSHYREVRAKWGRQGERSRPARRDVRQSCKAATNLWTTHGSMGSDRRVAPTVSSRSRGHSGYLKVVRTVTSL